MMLQAAVVIVAIGLVWFVAYFLGYFGEDTIYDDEDIPPS